jgi:hypothetical protein
MGVEIGGSKWSPTTGHRLDEELWSTHHRRGLDG